MQRRFLVGFSFLISREKCKKQESEIMDKDQYEYKNTLCECMHIRDYHHGVWGYCYAIGCKCKQFVKLEGVKR